jgi:hypothetical protein
MTKKPIAFGEQNSELLLYQTEDGVTRIDVRLVNETVWLTQAQMAELFQKDKRTVSEHIQNIFAEGELSEDSAVRKSRTTAADGKEYLANFYNLDVIISVGYRVKSHHGTQFRQWATQRLREYIIKGFALDDARLASGRTTDSYFDELISRVRTIRTSEYNLYRKVCEIYATSFDYDSRSGITQEFYATVQNKMHWAVHGHTAAEIIKKRANASRLNMGLTSFKSKTIHASDVTTAKNYLTGKELKQLELLVDQYLSFAELQAMNRRPMHMKDWKQKLDAFLTLNDREILKNAGRISKQTAYDHALTEYEKFSSRKTKQQNANDLKDLETRMKEIPSSKSKRGKTRHEV